MDMPPDPMSIRVKRGDEAAADEGGDNQATAKLAGGRVHFRLVTGRAASIHGRDILPVVRNQSNSSVAWW
jgi:hypothetical protein